MHNQHLCQNTPFRCTTKHCHKWSILVVFKLSQIIPMMDCIKLHFYCMWTGKVLVSWSPSNKVIKKWIMKLPATQVKVASQQLKTIFPWCVSRVKLVCLLCNCSSHVAYPRWSDFKFKFCGLKEKNNKLLGMLLCNCL